MNVTTKRLDALKHPKKNVALYASEMDKDLCLYGWQ